MIQWIIHVTHITIIHSKELTNYTASMNLPLKIGIAHKSLSPSKTLTTGTTLY